MNWAEWEADSTAIENMAIQKKKKKQSSFLDFPTAWGLWNFCSIKHCNCSLQQITAPSLCLCAHIINAIENISTIEKTRCKNNHINNSDTAIMKALIEFQGDSQHSTQKKKNTSREMRQKPNPNSLPQGILPPSNFTGTCFIYITGKIWAIKLQSATLK